MSESEEGLKTEVGVRVRENLMLPLKVEEETKSQEPGGFYWKRYGNRFSLSSLQKVDSPANINFGTVKPTSDF